MKRSLFLLVVLSLCCAMVAAFSRTLAAEQKDPVHAIGLPVLAFDLADGPSRDKVSGSCGIRHGLDHIPMQPKMSRAQWAATVAKMIKVFGAPVPQEDADKIVDYLSVAYGAGK